MIRPAVVLGVALCLVAVASPAAGAATVEVLDTSVRPPRPCPPVSVVGMTPTGGCRVLASGGRFDQDVDTAVGRFRFGSCQVDYTVYIGGDGRTLTSLDEFEGRSPCPDAQGCFPGEFQPVNEHYLWPGRIQPGSGASFEHQVDVCLDTCLGRFEGRLTMRLEQFGADWRARIDGGRVGASGWNLGSGSWRLRRSRGEPIPTPRPHTEIEIRAAGT